MLAIPSVLADEILKRPELPYDLVVKLLYGCGLRLFECLGLRVQCMNFDAGIVTVHDGKGQKDRTVPLPLFSPLSKSKWQGFMYFARGDDNKKSAPL